MVVFGRRFSNEVVLPCPTVATLPIKLTSRGLQRGLSLTEILRNGARALLGRAIEAEVPVSPEARRSEDRDRPAARCAPRPSPGA